MSSKWCDIELERLKALPWGAERIQKSLAIIRKREAERFPNGQAARYAAPLTPEQVARIRELKNVPVHELSLDDKFDRKTFLVQWCSVTHRNHHFYAERLAKHLALGGQEWTFWREKASETPNVVPPVDFYDECNNSQIP